jgi:GAF domain-containing protein
MAGDVGAVTRAAFSGLVDPARLAAVRETGLLGSAAAASWDALTALAATLLEAPMGFMTIADDEHSYWLSCSGVDLASDADRVNPVDESFCQYVIEDRAPFVVDDAAGHPRTRGNPSVSLLGVRAWAGYPVLDAAGQALGSFCVVDTVPRVWSPAQVAMLGTLAAAASAQVQLLAALVAERRADERLKRLARVASQLGSAVSLEDLTEVVNEALPVLGADGAAVVVLQDDGSMRLGIGDRLGEQTKLSYAHLPADDPLPACHVARTGQPLQLPTQRSGVEFTPQMAAVYEATGRYAWAFTPLVVDGTVSGIPRGVLARRADLRAG